MAQPGKSKQKTQALSLLDGILEETQKEASSEARRLKAELEAKRRREADAKRVEEERKRAAAQERIDAELERQRAAQERREAAAEALRIEALRAQGLWQEPEVAAPAAVVEAPVTLRPIHTTQEVLAATKRSPLPMIAAAAALLAVAGAGAAYVAMSAREYVDTTTTYSQVEVGTLALGESQQQVGFRPIPVAEVPEEVAAEPAREARPRSRDRDRDRDRDEAREPAPPTIDLDRGLIRGRE